jgi:hypothetical protein
MDWEGYKWHVKGRSIWLKSHNTISTSIMNHYQTIVTILIIAANVSAASFHVKIKAQPSV